MNLVELLSGIVEETAIPGSDFQIKGIALDSREVKKDYVFFALAGAMEHGLLYAKQAIENGAFAVIYDSQGSDEFQLGQFEVELLRVKNLRVKLGYIADRFYQSPSKELAVIGVTGT
ncbi:MAG TPA: UDP-N-acetylmuramoyl-L-alanyl-D-glutamate--2,6-diaminopimelate ligase, partial [Methylococcaceae bacterium]|nr:UDP-N-acetylmuramoyl-L-alanyl-D-glutamate--2,6-diaminopimelate ligase [Methylococcaceae bacterium]